MTEKEILELFNQLQPKLDKVLRQTTPQHRDDLKQDLIEKMLLKLNKDDFHDVPGLFEFIDQQIKR